MNTKTKLAISAIILFTVIVTSIVFPSPLPLAFNNNIKNIKEDTSSTILLNIGYFPNINHAQAVIGLGNGNFQKVLGDNIKVRTFIFNAGPSASK
jgi:NitT/TauT family transport system substrate-binding protein